jgi:hypothetical protein
MWGGACAPIGAQLALLDNGVSWNCLVFCKGENGLQFVECFVYATLLTAGKHAIYGDSADALGIAKTIGAQWRYRRNGYVHREISNSSEGSSNSQRRA